jgi:hypothetical protein
MTFPSPPPKRRRHLPPPAPTRDSRSRLHHMVRSHEERERPFDPEHAPSWRGSSHDLVVNPSGFQEDLKELVRGYYRTLDTPKSEDQIYSEVLTALESRDTEEALGIANRLLDGFGVEALGPSDMRDGPLYLYVNFGDTYNPTIMWSRKDNKIFVAMNGWGTVWEDEGEPDMFDEAWDDWLEKEFERDVWNATEYSEASEKHGSEIFETEGAAKELFQRALSRAQNGAPSKTPELVWESDGSLFVHHLDRVVREAASMIEEGWRPSAGAGLMPNGHLRMFKFDHGKLAEDPVGHHVTMTFRRQELLGTVRYVDERHGMEFLTVQFFNGDWWPVAPAANEVGVLKDDDEATVHTRP